MPTITALVPAFNEAGSIGATIEALLAQSRVPDRIIVIPNGCTDDTASIAGSYPVTVLELPKLEHKKSEALNRAWNQYGVEADIVICLDADTVLPANAVADWEKEFMNDTPPGTKGELAKPLGGSSSKFTMLGGDFFTRLQRAEFAKWTDTALRRQRTSVLAGTGCAISGEALRQVARKHDREGPWVYGSQVEDFELTYRIRQLGYRCQVSPSVRAYTDSMKTIPALWNQRMKWQVGTVEDLLSIGINRLTLFDWWQQASGLFMAFMRYVWVVLLAFLALRGGLQFSLVWMVIVPLSFAGLEVASALRIPHRDTWDIIFAGLIIPAEVFAWLRAAWFCAAWAEALLARFTGKRKDRWQLQYAADGTL